MSIDGHPLLAVLLTWCIVSLGVGGVVQGGKYPLQAYLILRNRYPEEHGADEPDPAADPRAHAAWRRSEHRRIQRRRLWVWGLRTATIYLGAVVGAFGRSVWPADADVSRMLGVWLGVSAGVFSSTTYDVFDRIMRGAPPVALSALAARLRGSSTAAADGARLDDVGSVSGDEGIDTGTSFGAARD
jgi:hypothetical protein